MWHILAVGLALFCSVALRANAQSVTTDDPGRAATAESSAISQSELIVHPVRNSRPQQIAEALKNLFRADPRVPAVELSESGVLFVRVHSEVRDEVLRVLEVFDRPPQMVDVQVLLLRAGKDAEGLPQTTALSGPIEQIMETITQLEASKRVVIADRIEVPTLEHSKSLVQRQHRTPFAKGIQATQSGVTRLETGLVPTGLGAHVTTHVMEGNRVFVELRIDASEIEGAVPFELSAGGDSMDVFGDLSLETTLQLDDGHAEAVRVAFNDAYNDTWPVMLVITARIRGAGGQAKELPSLPGLGVDVSDHLNLRPPPGDDGSRNWQPPPGDDSSRYRLYAVKLIEKYDQDLDKLLTQEEWAATRWSRSMQLAEVDTDGDGKISAEELAKAAAQR